MKIILKSSAYFKVLFDKIWWSYRLYLSTYMYQTEQCRDWSRLRRNLIYRKIIFCLKLKCSHYFYTYTRVVLAAVC